MVASVCVFRGRRWHALIGEEKGLPVQIRSILSSHFLDWFHTTVILSQMRLRSYMAYILYKVKSNFRMY